MRRRLPILRRACPAALVITSGRGLVAPDTVVTMEDLQGIASIPIDAADPRYREPLDRDCRALAERAGQDCRFVLLGSVATVKYLAPMVAVFGERLCFPEEFVGRGDMSRGGLMLRCVTAGEELLYEPLGWPHAARAPAAEAAEAPLIRRSPAWLSRPVRR